MAKASILPADVRLRIGRNHFYDLSLVPDGFEPFEAVVVSGRDPVRITAVVVALFVGKTQRTDDGHLHWLGSRDGNRLSACVSRLVVHAASLAWVIANRRDMPEGCIGANTCGDPLCVHHEHVEIRRRIKGNYGHGSPGPVAQTVEELTPPFLHRLALAQFGDDAFTPRASEPRQPPRQPRHPTAAPAVSPGSRTSAAPLVLLPATPLPAVPAVPAISCLDHETFLEIDGVRAVTFRSGGTIVFTPRGHVEHETRIGAIERAMDLMSSPERAA